MDCVRKDLNLLQTVLRTTMRRSRPIFAAVVSIAAFSDLRTAARERVPAVLLSATLLGEALPTKEDAAPLAALICPPFHDDNLIGHASGARTAEPLEGATVHWIVPSNPESRLGRRWGCFGQGPIWP